MLPKIKVEVVVLDEDVARVLNVISTAARTGEMGDGKLCALPVENAVCVRRRGEGGDAIQVNRRDCKVLRINKYGKLGIM